MSNTAFKFKEVCEKYGFGISEGQNWGGEKFVSLVVKDTDNDNIDWIKYYPDTDTVRLMGNTDNCNIWFYETREDLTPERLVQFVGDLNISLDLYDQEVFVISELIDPEDWQEIAGVNDAYEDTRYYNK